MKYYLAGIIGILSLASVLVFMPLFTPTVYEQQSGVAQLAEAEHEGKTVVTPVSAPTAPDTRPVITHVPLPAQVKAIYMSSCVAGTPSFRDRLVAFANETEINSIVIDIKDYSGSISFDPVDESWQYAWNAAECGARDMKEFIARLHAAGIFVIGRITVFQDPLYTSLRPDLAVKRVDRTTVWQDHKGLSFIEVGAREYWDHVVQLSVEAYNIGFDELNFDYVRYPSDGPMDDISFPLSEASEYGTDKQANLEAFFAYLHEQLADESRYQAVRHSNTGRASTTPYTSADLFGMTTTNYDDLSIGQVLERAIPYFDFIAPMVYPSHYPNSFLGLGNPNDYPYKVVNYAMQAGVDRVMATTTVMPSFTHTPETVTTASGTVRTTGAYLKPAYSPRVLRTWIQDFDYGGDYDAADVRAQIQASYDAGVLDWMVWAPSNIYTRGGYLDAASSTADRLLQ